MSYCRWSSDGYNCDVYVYEDVSGGYTCHVAGLRIVNLNEAPENPSHYFDIENKDDAWQNEYMSKHRDYMNWLREKAIREPIGLPYDGKSFNVDTAEDMADRLIELKQLGYTVPEYAIESLREDVD